MYVDCQNRDLRLEVSESSLSIVSGIVQYCLNNHWSTVCTSSPAGAWGMNEAQVACRQLGYQGNVDEGSITGDGFMIHDAGDDSQSDSGCLSTTSSHFITLNCPNSEVSNLQECGVMEVEGCDCTTKGTGHARVDCVKGTYTVL